MDQKAYWVGFNLVKGIGAVRLQGLIDFFGDLQMAWNAPVDALRNAGLGQRIIENFVQVRAQTDPEAFLERVQRQGIQVLTWMDAEYPRLLKEIGQPPPVLYLLGSFQPEDEWAAAIVGTRRVTAYGRQVAEETSAMLARNGLTVVSGLARGVDAIAHQAALAVGGRTIAVLGCGVDRIYPPEHKRLAEQIIAHGCILSDYAPGTPPESSNFPPRNRIIAGLSRVTIVIEAGQTSGALITAGFAAEQGREVFAVPGPIHAPQSQGTNNLIQQGAHPLLHPGEVLEVLHLEQVQVQQQARRVIPADAVEAELLKLLGSEPLHVDDIQARSGLSIDKVSATLTLMELKGLVRQVGGMNYIAVREPP